MVIKASGYKYGKAEDVVVSFTDDSIEFIVNGVEMPKDLIEVMLQLDRYHVTDTMFSEKGINKKNIYLSVLSGYFDEYPTSFSCDVDPEDLFPHYEYDTNVVY